MGDEQDRGALLLEDVEGLVADAVAQPVVEAGERLVHQEDRRLRRQRAGQRHPLLLAAGELVRELLAVAGEADPVEQPPRPLGAGAGGAAQPEGDVPGDAEVGEEREVLEHQADAAGLGRDVAGGVGDHPAGNRHRARVLALDPGGDPQQRGLAAAGGAEQAGDLAGAELERDIVQHPGAGVAVADMAQRQPDPIQCRTDFLHRPLPYPINFIRYGLR